MNQQYCRGVLSFIVLVVRKHAEVSVHFTKLGNELEKLLNKESLVVLEHIYDELVVPVCSLVCE